MNKSKFSLAILLFAAAFVTGCVTDTAHLKVGIISDVHMSGSMIERTEQALRYFSDAGADGIIVAGDMARDVSHEYKVDPRRTASLLDIFSCVFQGIIPYGAQLLSAAALANATVTSDALHTSPAAIVGGMWYCWILAAVGLLSIFVPFADGVCRKDPWNWEYGCAQSAVAAKKALLEKEAEDISAQ